MIGEINNSADIIDSRDIIERIDDLRDTWGEDIGRYNELKAQMPRLDNELEDEMNELSANIDWDEVEELEKLEALQEECENATTEWKYGATLIRESYWVDFVEQDMKDLGYIQGDPWFIVIDWEATADNISQDYSTVDFDGIKYYLRNS